MLNKKMEEALNKQINAETYSAYLYWSMSAALEKMNLPGFASWMRVQAQEEMVHASMFYKHIIERDGTVRLAAVDAPPHQWSGVQQVFEAALKHEQHVSGLINSLFDLAVQEKDHAANLFLQWFVNEQIEEEKNARDIIGRLEIAGGTAGGLYMLDKEMAARVFTMPAAEQQP
ncbi:MAG TPA: ferritin [Anaerohalosphaeraceae bacterium]|nr:ferritin [Phycisphaerae bacterium]HOK95679.1 ferritin [Anaerohalosphaeraceae bacterium]HOL32254.1 ferritin [Anaerohalosphaeraceae bacterium]HOM76306.1 ferritin [Anaerohalosphaeraceae bacterium]HPC64496.1 ferritin [Anaerohalosphaeraceae bacterium]